MSIKRCSNQNNDLRNSHATIINVLGLHGIVLCRSLINLVVNTIVGTHSMSSEHERIVNKHNISLLALCSSYLAKTVL